MEPALINLLLAADPVVALAGRRVYPAKRPQDSALPAVVLRKVSHGGGHTMDGPEGCTEARVQLDCYGGTYDAAATLARTVRNALVGYEGTASGVVIQQIFLADERDTPTDGEDPEAIQGRQVDLTVWFVEA